jgi:transcription antitermination protein NusB
MEAENFGEEAGADETSLPDNRRGARQVALQVLYWEASSPGDVEVALRELGERFALSPQVRDFAARLVQNIGEHRDRLDELIAGAATHWQRERLARIDHLILRLALAEILYFDDVPVRVSIDEAIELAKLYSTGQSYAFINGVLDAIVRRQGLPV